MQIHYCESSNDILDFSKIEAGKMVLSNIEFDLHKLLEEVANMFSYSASDKGLDFICQTSIDLPIRVFGDPERIRQLLTNLIGNALKFTKKGEVTLNVSLDSIVNGKAVISFNVTDFGIGISNVNIQNLFTPFNQLDASRTKTFGGTGLGLSICKRLVDMMGGQIGVESKEGSGSKFWFEVPFGLSTANQDQLCSQLPDLSSIRVLIVDECNTHQKLISDYLNEANCENETAIHEHEILPAIKRISKEDQIIVVILDQFLENKTSIDIARSIKEHPLGKEIRIILMAAGNAIPSQPDLQSAGISALLIKPIWRDYLYAALQPGATEWPPTWSIRAFEQENRLPGTQSETLSDTSHRVLLAEDNSINYELANAILTKNKFKVDIVNNGMEALDALQKEEYDIVLMDVQMPVMDGLEATRLVRSGEGKVLNPRIPIIALTANAMQADKENCLQAGMDDYIAKPFDPGELINKINRFVLASSQDNPFPQSSIDLLND